MCQGSQPAEPKSCAQLQIEYALLIENEMRRQGVSIRCLVADGTIKSSHRNGFYKRLRDGSMTQADINKLNARLEIDPIRAAISLKCFRDPASYQDPSCSTTAYMAESLAIQLNEEMAACEGNFDGIERGLCNGLAKRTVNEIAKNQARLTAQRSAIAEIDQAYG